VKVVVVVAFFWLFLLLGELGNEELGCRGLLFEAAAKIAVDWFVHGLEVRLLESALKTRMVGGEQRSDVAEKLFVVADDSDAAVALQHTNHLLAKKKKKVERRRHKGVRT
jgi:hypothetical protein